MSVIKHCLVCGTKLIKYSSGYGDSSFSMGCPNYKLDNWPSWHYKLWYDERSELYEFVITHPNGFRLNSIIMQRSADGCPERLVISSPTEQHIMDIYGISIPYKHDLNYLDTKIKTIVVFG